MTAPLNILPDEETPEVPRRAVFIELGSGGVRKAGGYVDADFLPELNGWNGARKYTEMSENDPVLSAMVFAITMLLRNAKWRIDPADTDDASVAGRDWLEEELFKKAEVDWTDVMGEVASMFVYGYAPLEIVYARRESGELGLKGLYLRMQETIFKWGYASDKRTLTGLWQQDSEFPMTFIPLDKVLLFRTRTMGGNPEGKSILRGAYVPWMRKKAIEEAEGRAAMRAAGIVVMTLPSQIMMTTASPEEKAVFAAYKAMANNLAQDRQGAIILPSDVDPETKVPRYDVKYVLADGRRSGDMSPLVERIDKRMSMTVLADFILLGQQSTGSFALSTDKTELFTTAVGAWLSLIQGAFNRQLVPRLWKLNGFPEETMPKIVAADLDDRDLGQLGAYIQALSAAGMPLFPDPELQDYLREAGGLPEASEETKQRQEEQLTAAHEAETAQHEASVATARATADNKGVPPEKAAALAAKKGGVAKSRSPFFSGLRAALRKFNPNHYGPGARGGQFAPTGGGAAVKPQEAVSDKKEIAAAIKASFGTKSAYNAYVNGIAKLMPAGHKLEVHTNVSNRGALLLQVIGFHGTPPSAETIDEAIGVQTMRRLGSSDSEIEAERGLYRERAASVIFEREFKRNKKGELIVHHQRFMLGSEFQGKGTGKAMTRFVFEQYKKIGVTRVELTANLDVGGYAWARLGFTPTPGGWASLADTIDQRMGKLSVHSRRGIDKVLRPSGQFLTMNPKTIWKIADARAPHAAAPHNNLGKTLLQGAHWEGRFDMKDAESWDRMMRNTEP